MNIYLFMPILANSANPDEILIFYSGCYCALFISRMKRVKCKYLLKNKCIYLSNNCCLFTSLNLKKCVFRVSLLNFSGPKFECLRNASGIMELNVLELSHIIQCHKWSITMRTIA